MPKIIDNSNIDCVSEKPRLKDRLKFKYNFKKRELKYKLDQVKEDFILKFIMPQFLEYVRSVIVAKGLNPDKDPFVKPVPLPTAVDNLIATLDKTNSGSTRGRRTYFGHYVPAWVSESFRDQTKHILYKNKNKPLPVKETPSEPYKAIIGISDEKNSDLGVLAIENFRNAMKNLTDKFPLDNPLDTSEQRADVRAQIIDGAKKELKELKEKTEKKTTKKPPVKKKVVKKTTKKAVTKKTNAKAKDPKFKGSFRRV